MRLDHGCKPDIERIKAAMVARPSTDGDGGYIGIDEGQVPATNCPTLLRQRAPFLLLLRAQSLPRLPLDCISCL